MARRSRRGPKSLFDKIKEIDAEFPEGLISATDDVLNQKLAGLAKEQTAIEEERAADTDLKSLQEQAKHAASGYNERTQAVKLKRRYVYGILKERGKAP